MSNQKRDRACVHLSSPQTVRARIGAELAQAYVEVAPEGITVKECFALYMALFRGGREHLLESVRSLFRLHPVH